MMTPLRQRTLEELQRRNYGSGTIRLYLQHVTHFAQHFHRPPDQLGAEEIRQYQLFLGPRWKCLAVEWGIAMGGARASGSGSGRARGLIGIKVIDCHLPVIAYAAVSRTRRQNISIRHHPHISSELFLRCWLEKNVRISRKEKNLSGPLPENQHS